MVGKFTTFVALEATTQMLVNGRLVVALSYGKAFSSQCFFSNSSYYFYHNSLSYRSARPSVGQMLINVDISMSAMYVVLMAIWK